jgi:hypothetical protein
MPERRLYLLVIVLTAAAVIGMPIRGRLRVDPYPIRALTQLIRPRSEACAIWDKAIADWLYSVHPIPTALYAWNTREWNYYDMARPLATSCEAIFKIP